jgi:hypothetical protein
MKWETIHTEYITEKYVFRYVTIEKLIDFFDTNSIFLARLDTFEDNLENISPKEINGLKTTFLKIPKNANPDRDWDKKIENSRHQIRAIRNKLALDQKHRYVSCWILNDVESFGMWDTYGKSGFAIRFEREYFQKLVEKSIKLQVNPTDKIDLLVLGKVFYQNFDTMHQTLDKSKMKYAAFRKHLSFKHESEYRIVGFTNQTENEIGLRFKLPDLESLNFEIFANPRLSSFQFQQYEKIVAKYSKTKKLKESELKNWLEFRNLI